MIRLQTVYYKISCLLGFHRWGMWYDTWIQDDLYKVEGMFKWHPIQERECKICHTTEWHYI